jgi:hypothetical protein
MTGVGDRRGPRTVIAIVAGVLLFVTATLALAVLDVPNALPIAAATAALVTGVAIWRGRRA